MEGVTAVLRAQFIFRPSDGLACLLMQVQNVGGSMPGRMLLCQHHCYPQLLLQCARLRQVSFPCISSGGHADACENILSQAFSRQASFLMRSMNAMLWVCHCCVRSPLAPLLYRNSTDDSLRFQVLMSLGDSRQEEMDVLPVIFGADAKPTLAQKFCQAELRDLAEIQRQIQLIILQQGTMNREESIVD